MAQDNATPADEGRIVQARRLAEQGLAARRAGDQEAADRLLDEATKLDPNSVEDVLEEAESVGQTRLGSHAVPLPAGGGFRVTLAPPASELGAWQARGTAGGPLGGASHATRFAITLKVNGADHALTVDARTTLLDALRDRLHLSGTKKGCALGQCGSCTVLLEGRRINACLMLAVMAEGQAITTIEGLVRDGALHPVQQAFIDHDAFQCGYCTPGQIMSAVGLIEEGRAGSAEEIREQMSGNLCRCGAYVNIVAAVLQAARES